MIVIFRVAFAAVVCALSVTFFSGVAQADIGDAPEVEAQRLAHILGYTASDYGGAVSNGAIASETEFEEQRALLTDAAKIAAHIAPSIEKQDGKASVDLVARVAAVRALVEAKAPEEQVIHAVSDLRREIAIAFRLVDAPAAAPDRARGEALYVQHCSTCHGTTGAADTQRASTLNPHPANFHDPKVSEPLSPQRVAGTIRFGINGTAMVPFTFLSETDRWSIAFYVMGLRHASRGEKRVAGAPTYTLAELASASDRALRLDLESAHVPADSIDGMVAGLRREAPYEERGARTPLAIARADLNRAAASLRRGDKEAARAAVIDAYLEGIEPVESALRAADGSIVPYLEAHFLALRSALQTDGDGGAIEENIAELLRDVSRAEVLLTAPRERPSFVSTALSSAGILLREGVEAALLLAALLGIAGQAGLADKKRFVHIGWVAAAACGGLTWVLATRLITLSGASRELIEGVTALLATSVLFYVSYSLLAKREVARWMKFLRGRVSPRRAALSLFGVSFLAVYREAFETVLFYQALLASNASGVAAAVGAGAGAVALVALVLGYSRAGRFTPPQVFFRVSSVLLYGLSIAFAGQGIAALQTAGKLPLHPIPLPTVAAIGLYPTLETCAAQAFLLALALIGVLASRPRPAAPSPSEGASSTSVPSA